MKILRYKPQYVLTCCMLLVGGRSLTSTLQSIEKSFNLSVEDREKLQKSNYDLQVINLYCELRINYRSSSLSLHWDCLDLSFSHLF